MSEVSLNRIVSNNNVNTKSSQSANKTKESDNKTSNTIKYTACGVSALAIIGLATFAILSHKKPNLKQAEQNLNKIEDLKNQHFDLSQQITTLKNSIRNKYWSQRYAKLDTVGGKYSSFESAVAQGDKIQLNQAIEEINGYQSDMAELSQKARERFKGKLVTDANGKQVYQGGLLDDKDYLEVRKLRKRYVQEFNSGEYSNTGKISIANEIIKSKVTGKPMILNGKELPMDEALRLFREPNIDIGKYLIDNKYVLGGSNSPLSDSVNPISISDLDSVAGNVVENFKKAHRIKERISVRIPELKAKYQDVLVKLAQETRQSDDVKQLKELQAKLKTISDELNTLKQQ